jgi:hypothetical protein
LLLHFDKQNKEIIIYNSNKHFHSSFTHTLLQKTKKKKHRGIGPRSGQTKDDEIG